MPFYNVLPFMEEAIESVLHQTYTNWELLLIDDGSSDGSTEIALRYTYTYPNKIYYLHHPGHANKGTSPSRNLGIVHSNGDYIALLDSDDSWLLEKLAFQISIIEHHPEISLLCGATQYWYSWADKDKKDIVVSVGGPKDIVINPPKSSLLLYPLGKGAAPCLCSIIIKKAAMQRIHGFEESFTGLYQFYEDQAFLIKLYLEERVFISSAMMDRYRQRKNSNMSIGEDPEVYNKVKKYFLNWLNEYLNQKKIAFPEVRKKIKQALWQYNNPFLYKIRTKIKPGSK